MPASIASLLKRGAELAAVSDSPRLDVEVLLCHVLGQSRTYLFTWPERQLSGEQLAQFDALFARRLQGEPVAHLIGHREFWSLPLAVTPATLIPRPDTELLVELALHLSLPEAASVLDLGTGTGAIALALASERPEWRILALDVVAAAVGLAESNRRLLGFDNVRVQQGDWFEGLGEQRFDLVVSNPPYIEADDPHLSQGDVRFEPLTALVADDRGLADLAQIIAAAPQHLTERGWLLLEHGWQQGEAVRQLMQSAGFADVVTHRDLGDRDRATLGRWAGPA
ncbi:MAG: peptide chain release factor N(5)-glutamine methyltransferase [Porticoccaceae bacterium]